MATLTAGGHCVFRLRRAIWPARKKAAALESPDESVFKAVADSVKGFIEHCQSEGLKDSTISKYRNVLGKLVEFCELSGSTA